MAHVVPEIGLMSYNSNLNDMVPTYSAQDPKRTLNESCRRTIVHRWAVGSMPVGHVGSNGPPKLPIQL